MPHPAPYCHAELVSASIHPDQPLVELAKWTLKQVQGDDYSRASRFSAAVPLQWRQAKRGRQVDPLRILALDEADLPLSAPALQLLLSQDGIFHVAEHLEPNQPVHRVSARKPRNAMRAMLVKSRDEVGCHPDIQRPMGFAAKNIDARLPIHRASERAVKWMLKQVQHDGSGESRA